MRIAEQITTSYLSEFMYFNRTVVHTNISMCVLFPYVFILRTIYLGFNETNYADSSHEMRTQI
jgi:hypothetical protein